MSEPTLLLVVSLMLLCPTCLAGIVCVVKGVRWDNDRGEPGHPAHGSLTELWSARLLETAPISSRRHRRARAVVRSGERTDDPELAPAVHALAATRIIYWWNPWTWSGQALLFVTLAGTIGLNPATYLWGTAAGLATAVLAVGMVVAQPRMVARYGRALDAHRPYVAWGDPRETVPGRSPTTAKHRDRKGS
ncbi:hypothetical protein IDM40_08630 [Nocardiopsis sp. HNM0947]|uniref:TIGR04222 domain-containing membrane protein n=1 Tax=Nocardiopsis coralli TaxID=2772213 RepID=A0ABR9P4J4_9ACTN|nr:hypothetical protein [Nocardiopsis coralli]MBE2998766.1 hypothetical protein [Nocardiopsis coralli]